MHLFEQIFGICLISACSVGYSTEQVLVLKDLRCKPNVSPTNTLLWELGCEGYRVSDLYDKLREIRRRRDMEILEEYGNYNLLIICVVLQVNPCRNRHLVTVISFKPSTISLCYFPPPPPPPSLCVLHMWKSQGRCCM